MQWKNNEKHVRPTQQLGGRNAAAKEYRPQWRTMHACWGRQLLCTLASVITRFHGAVAVKRYSLQDSGCCKMEGRPHTPRVRVHNAYKHTVVIDNRTAFGRGKIMAASRLVPVTTQYRATPWAALVPVSGQTAVHLSLGHAQVNCAT